MRNYRDFVLSTGELITENTDVRERSIHSLNIQANDERFLIFSQLKLNFTNTKPLWMKNWSQKKSQLTVFGLIRQQTHRCLFYTTSMAVKQQLLAHIADAV